MPKKIKIGDIVKFKTTDVRQRGEVLKIYKKRKKAFIVWYLDGGLALLFQREKLSNLVFIERKKEK